MHRAGLGVRDVLLHTIGNLTLLTGKLNQSLSDAPWSKKRPAFQEFGLLALNGSLAKQETWDEAAICERAGALLGKAVTDLAAGHVNRGGQPPDF